MASSYEQQQRDRERFMPVVLAIEELIRTEDDTLLIATADGHFL